MSKARFLANVVTSTGAISSDVLSTVVDGAPSALNTLNEIAAAINDDPNYATTLTTALSGKVPTSTTLTINGVGHSLAASRTWTVDALPSQSTHSGKYLTTDGTTASWSAISSGNVTTALGYTPVTNARSLTINGTSYDLTENRTWTVDALPSQTGNSGKYLTTNGTVASWAAVSATPTAVSDQTNSSTGYFDLPAGTTEQRPETPSTGMLRYNTTTGYVESYTSSGWSAIATPPSVTAISPVTFNGEQGTSFTINGSFFDSSASVKFITNSGTEYTAASVSYVNTSQLIATTPRDFTVSEEPLGIKVINGSALFSILSNVIDCGGVPTWSTAAGTLGTFDASSSVNTSVSAGDPDAGATITYSITSGSLPSGLTLNSSTGAITGTTPVVSSDTTYTFTITATDNAGNSTARQFSIVVQVPAPTWNTASGSLGSDFTQRNSTFTTSASTVSGSITYSLVSGSLPSGQSLNTSTGTISGTASGVSDYSSSTYNFTLRATNTAGKFSNRAFSITIASRYVGYSCFTANESSSISGTAPTGNVFNRVDFSSYGTPNGSCGAFTIGGCNSSSSNAYNPTPTASFSTSASNEIWGDPCGGVGKRMYIQMSYGPF